MEEAGMVDHLVGTVKGLLAWVAALEGALAWQRYQFVETMAEVRELNDTLQECACFDVGGERFHAAVGPLQQYGDHLLGALTSGVFGGEVDSRGYIFVDRDPTFFPLVLDYLRQGQLSWPDDRERRGALQRELQYYGLAYDAPPEERPVVVAEAWQGDHFTAAVAIYNGASDSWHRLRPFGLTGRRMRWCSAGGGRLLVLHDPPGQTARVSQYDLWTDTVEVLWVLPNTPTLQHTNFCDIAAEGDVALVLLDRKTPRLLSISKKAPLPPVLHSLPIPPDAVCVVGGTVYVCGDRQLLMARLKGGPWVVVKEFLSPCSKGALLGWQGRLMALGNFDPARDVCRAVARAVDVYDPAAAAWTAYPDLPAELRSPSAAVIGGRPHVLNEFHWDEVTSAPIFSMQDGRWGLWGHVHFPQPFERFHMLMVTL